MASDELRPDRRKPCGTRQAAAATTSGRQRLVEQTARRRPRPGNHLFGPRSRVGGAPAPAVRKPSKIAPACAGATRSHENRLSCSRLARRSRWRAGRAVGQRRPAYSPAAIEERAARFSHGAAARRRPGAGVRVPARSDDLVDRPRAEARHAEQHLAVGGVHVDGKRSRCFRAQASSGRCRDRACRPRRRRRSRRR